MSVLAIRGLWVQVPRELCPSRDRFFLARFSIVHPRQRPSARHSPPMQVSGGYRHLHSPTYVVRPLRGRAPPVSTCLLLRDKVR